MKVVLTDQVFPSTDVERKILTDIGAELVVSCPAPATRKTRHEPDPRSERRRRSVDPGISALCRVFAILDP